MNDTHGGDLAAVAARYGVDPSTLADFSANIAPYGPPRGLATVLAQAARNPRMLAAYPSALQSPLERLLAQRLDVPAACIVAGAGATSLLHAAVRACDMREWLVPVPAFSEYRRAIENAGAAFAAFALDETFSLDVPAFVKRSKTREACGALVNTPHNPTGRALANAQLDALIAQCRPLILDEAFVDYNPASTRACDVLVHRQLVVVRSLTKFYALAGVRIGYAVAAAPLAARIRAAMPSWPVGTLDLAIAECVLEDHAYEQATRAHNATERAWLERELIELGFAPHPSPANFVFFDLGIAPGALDAVLEGLVRRGVVVRDCRSFESLQDRSYVRVAVLNRASNERLIAAFAAILRPV